MGQLLPAILSPEQAAEETLPYWAIGAFAGLRSAELERLVWRDVHFDEKVIEVPALSSKTASRRFVKIWPNLMAWLKPYQKKHGLICPIGLRKRLEADRKAADATEARHDFSPADPRTAVLLQICSQKDPEVSDS